MHILVNRDEQRDRDHALPPTRVTNNTVQAMMPIDPEGGGSWVAANDHGFVFCILNRYSRLASVEQSWQSRGELVRQLSQCENWSAVHELLQPGKLALYRPFSLLVFHGNNEPEQFSWSTTVLTQTVAPRSPVSSSKVLPRFVPWMRKRWAQLTLPKHPQLSDLEKYHLASQPICAHFGVNMSRPTSQTVSITRVELTTSQVTMSYWAGNLTALNTAQSESTTLQLRVPLHLSSSHVSRINLKTLMAQYNPSLAKALRGWQWRLLTWLVDEPGLNHRLTQLDKLPVDTFFSRALSQLRITPEVHAFRWPTTTARPVFLCNHPTGGIDGVMTLAILLKRFPNLKVIANDALATIEPLASRIIPINVFGDSRQSIHRLMSAFSSDDPLLIFPAGKTARFTIKGQLDDGDWPKSLAALIRRSQRPVVPLFIQSRNSILFYLLHALRRMLRVSTNLEMLLLPRETLKPVIRSPQLFVDLPISPTEVEACAVNDEKRINWLRTRSYSLPSQFAEANNDKSSSSCSSRK
ncbi:MAG: NRDE family protein [Idiomarina sp.]|nr:NRDE family protein [Idiomarina sp.]